MHRYCVGMSTENTMSELAQIRETGHLATIRMHDGSMTEYAEVVDFPKGDGHARVRIQPYRVLSGSRIVARGRRMQLTINQIDYITVHRDKTVPAASDD